MSKHSPSPQETQQASTGTFIATVNTKPDFNATKVGVLIDRWIEIYGVQSDSLATISTINLAMDLGIKNGKHKLQKPSKIQKVLVIATKTGVTYETSAATLHVDFDDAKERYNGRIKISAKNPETNECIEVVGEFNLHGCIRVSNDL